MNIDSKKIRSLCIDVKNWRISHAVSHDAMKCIKGPWVILEGQTDCRFAPARTAELNIAEDDETQTERGLGIIEHFSTESGEPAFMGAQVGLTQQQFASLLKDVESLAPSDTLKFVVCLDLYGVEIGLETELDKWSGEGAVPVVGITWTKSNHF